MIVAGVPVHVIQRGNNRSPCFVTDQDRAFYLFHLFRALGRFGCAPSRVLPDEQPRSSPHDSRRSSKLWLAHEVHKSAPFAVFQQAVQTQRFALGGALSFLRGAVRTLLADLLLLYRAQSGASRNGSATRRLSMVQLSIKRRWRLLKHHHCASPVSGAERGRSRAPAALSDAFRQSCRRGGERRNPKRHLGRSRVR